MKLSSIICVTFLFTFLLGCTTSTVEEKNPIEGTWELTTAEWSREDTTQTFPNSPYDRAIVFYGKTHFAGVMQDTSREASHNFAGTYVYKGDSLTHTLIMYPYYEDIGHSITYKVQIEGDKMVVTGADVHFYGFDWKTYYEEWKRID